MPFLKQVLRKVYRRHAHFCIARGQPIPIVKPSLDVSFRRASSENVSDVRSFRKEEVVTGFAGLLQHGQLGVLAYSNGRAVAHGWLIANGGQSTIRANRYFALQPREALVHFCSVDEEYRRQGIYQALLCELYRMAFASDLVDVIYVDTESDNAASRKAISKTATFVRNTHYLLGFGRFFEISWPSSRKSQAKPAAKLTGR
jgi:hypothetical protein